MAQIDDLEHEMEEVSAAYAALFAGKPRHTRDLKELDSLIRRVGEVASQADAADLDPTRAAPLREAAQKNVQLYQNERQAILAAQALGEDFEEIAELLTFVNLTFTRYQRHFAGQARNTRDSGLLTEMVQDLTAAAKRLRELWDKSPSAQLRQDLELIERNRDLYQQELQAISSAQRTGEREAQATAYATMANAQIQMYRDHFAGQSRQTRRPQLLQRMITEMERILGGMVRLQREGLKADFNQKNVTVVESNMRMYRTELEEIRKARQQSQLGEILDLLGGEANGVFEQYREHFAGKDRQKVDRALLGKLCDQLGEIARQMRDLRRAVKTEHSERNLEITLEQLVSFENEHDLISQAQAPAQSPAPTQ